MRFSTVVPLALTAAPLVVSAAGTLGFALGNTKSDGSCKFKADYESDFDALKGVSTLVRTYTSGGCNTAQQILPAAVAKGFKVVLGVWPDTDSAYDADYAALQNALSDSSNAGAVYAITVGSEALYRGSLTANALLTKIQNMTNTFPNIKIGTADSWNKFQDGTADPIIQGGVKLILANAFSYWQGQTTQNASHSYLDDLNQAFGRIQSVAGTLDIEIWNGETGWPTDGGTNYESAMAGTQNAATFFKQGVCAALAWGFNVFYFEAFDEPEKPASIGTNGQAEDESHWGSNHQLSAAALRSPALPPRSHQTLASPATQSGIPYVDSRSRSSSLWTALSPSQAIRPRSPSLPPLPKLPSYNSRLPSLESPPQHQRSDSSAYYTALWGSPYEVPSNSRAQLGGHQHKRSNSTVTGDGSPLHLQPRQGSRKPVPSPSRIDQTSTILRLGTPSGSRKLGAANTSVSSERTRKPRYGFTQDWLRTHLANRKDSERGNWWSDDSGNSGPESSATRKRKAEEPILEPWLDLDQVVSENQDLNQFPSRSGRALDKEAYAVSCSSPDNRKSSTRHHSLHSDETLKPQDFDELFGRTLQSVVGSNAMLASMYAVPTAAGFAIKSSSVEEKPLPPPPIDRSISEAPVLNNTVGASEPTSEVKRPSISSAISFQRPRKRVVWRGKTCVIALPLDDGSSSSKEYLTTDDKQARLTEWENKGFRTRGFDLSEHSQGQLLPHGQSRDIYPDPITWQQEWQERSYRVSIPDRKAWDDYVNLLKEEKLRALGVSFGGEDLPTRNSPGLMSMSRQSSTQNAAMPPPLSATTLSAASSRSQLGHSISPSMAEIPNPFGRPPPLTSPGPQQYYPPAVNAHFSKQSLSFSNGQLYGPPGHLPMHQPSAAASGNWAQQQYFNTLAGSRGVSPLVNGRGQSFRSTQSPVSPMSNVVNDGLFFEHDDVRRNIPLHASTQQLHRNQPTVNPRLGPPEAVPTAPAHKDTDEVHPIMYISQPEIASPLPQGHRHNTSESLQKEIDSAEYHLEESIRRQLDEEDELSLTSATNDDGPLDGSLSTRNGPLNGFAGAVRKPRSVISDLDTNPSLNGSPRLSANDSHPSVQAPVHTGHAPKVSISKLNVNAREFVLDPTKSYVPNMFAFSGNTAAPQAPKSQALPLQPPKRPYGTELGSKLNVAAPAFTPGVLQRVSIPSREFSFSSSMPTLKPDAPSFTPSAKAFHSTSGSDWSGSEKTAPRIFANFDSSQISKASKMSKAIPIVKPDETHSGDNSDSESQEDEFGRITQTDGRQKRMRRTDDDGDEIPLFVTPGLEVQLGEASLSGAASRNENPASIVLRNGPLPDKETHTSPSEDATGELKDLLGDLHSSGTPSSVGDQAVTESEDKDIQPFELKDAAEAANFDLARPRSSISVQSGKSEINSEGEKVLNATPKSNSVASPNSERQDAKSLSLSATVQPYEYNPDPAIFQFGFDTEPRPVARKTSAGGLGASRYAPQQNPYGHSSPSLDSESHHGEPRQGEHHQGEESLSRSRPLSFDRSVNDDGSHIEPSYQEIDAVMKHLNEDSDIGIERVQDAEAEQSSRSSPVRSVARSPRPLYDDSSDRPQRLSAPGQHKLPSSSPNRLQQPFQYLPQQNYGSSDSAAAELAASHDFVSKNARFSPSYKPPKHPGMALDSPVHRLNGMTDLPMSDWDDAISSGDEAKFLSRSNFFDHRVNDLIGAVVQKRLQPLERNIAEMNGSISRLLSRSASRRERRSISADVENSDADDEDDEEEVSPSRTRSPLKDRKYDKLKASIIDTLASQRQTTSSEESTKIMETLAELRASIEKQKSGPSGDIKNIIEEAVAKQMRGKSAPIASSHSSATAEKYQLQITGLESMLKIAESRAEDELRSRRQAEDALADHQRLLRIAQADAAEQRESAEETERSLRTFHEERLQAAQRYASLEAAEADLQRSVSVLTEENSALEGTIEEYRLSSSQWREEIDEARSKNKNLDRTIHVLKEETDQARSDNKNLDRTIHALKVELEDGIRGRRALKTKFDRLQEELVAATQNVARDQSLWRRRVEEHRARHELQSARLEAEARTRERLELEIERLETQEKEAMKSRFLVDQVQGENGRLVAMVNDLKAESDLVHKENLRFQRELHDVKETGRLDIQRVHNAMEADVTRTAQEAHLVQTEHATVVAQLQTQVEDAKADIATLKLKHERMLEDANAEATAVKSKYDHMLEDAKTDVTTIKSRYELMLEEASESRDNALRDAAESREAALQEHYRFHERTLDELKNMHERAMAATLQDKNRTLAAALEDRDRAMAAAMEDKDRALTNALEDKRLLESHLQGRLELADDKTINYQERIMHMEEKLEIAKAAAQAAVQAAQSARASPSPTSRAPATISRGSDVGCKISPQALRESIFVLQEQLQEREGQIEKLQQELAAVDKDSPAKIKERDIEISWLRELLGVRIDDLQDVIMTLSQPSYDREAVKDAAIRLKANLQMEQQEKERAMAGGQTFPSLASITNLTASPRALPFAAAAALGNWGKGRFGSLAEMANGSASQTPSKSSPQSMFSGLLTPPSTALRQTPQPPASNTASMRSAAGRRPLRDYSSLQQNTPRQSVDRSLSDQPPPETPRLLRHASYDQDAESGHYSLDRYTRDDDESTVDGNVKADREDGPFGPSIVA